MWTEDRQETPSSFHCGLANPHGNILESMRIATLAAFAALPWTIYAQPADLVLMNGKIVTMNPAAPTAQLLAARGDRIVALGVNADAQKWVGRNTKVIDLKGQLAIPGFIEGHGHFVGIGEYRQGLDLR